MAATIEIDTIQGVLGGTTWFHLDVVNDVLYLRDQAHRGDRVFGEETPEGFTILRTDSGEFAGLTAVSFWKHFGIGLLNHASIQTVKERVTAWTQIHLPVAQ